MTDFSTSKDKALKAIGKALLCAVCVFVAGAINAPRVSAADMPQVPQLKAASEDQPDQPVPIDQQPLTVAEPLAPNIVLMLDDSGSMEWNAMPDGDYLAGHSDDDLRNSAINGIYYNPNVTYNPPPRSDSTDKTPDLYPGNDVSSFPEAYANPFDEAPSKESVMDSGSVGKNSGGGAGSYSFNYYDEKNERTCSGYIGNYCYKYKYVYYYSFMYTDPSSGISYRVAKNAAACSHFDNCVAATDTSGTSAPPGIQAGVNIMNWYSYYSSRIRMAKSSLMNAFLKIDPAYRIGFGSLHNNGGYPKHTTGGGYNKKTVSDVDLWCGSGSGSCSPTSTSSNYKKVLAEVKPFGNGSDATQKSMFWKWIINAKPSNGTPLPSALQAMGEYYQSDQPWETSDTDDTKLACRQSYAILTTDGFWNGSRPSLGNVDKPSDEDIPKVKNPKTGKKQKTYSPAQPFSDEYSNTLADVAMYYWNHDLQPKVSNEVPVSDKADPAFWQHMTTFTIGLGFVPTGINPEGTSPEKIFDWARGGDAIEGFSWPQPSENSVNNIADLLHAGVNGHGGFYSATSPEDFTKGLQDALKRIASNKGSGASLSASGATIGTGTYIYQVLYHTGDWSGSLLAYELDDNGDPADDPSWSAEAQMPDPDDRNIYTYNPDKSGSDADVAFEFDNLSDAEKTALGDKEDVQKKMVQYLRGKLIDEDGWRARLILGDIVDSQPIYVTAPDPDLYSDSRMDFAGSSDYKTFADNKKDVTPTLYVAANDGMLHGFDADTGEETYAYLPAAVILHGSETGDHHISQIADPDYGYQNSDVPHQYFNDGQLTVADVYMSGSWKVVLVGTTGRGHAKAVYALDVTDPDDVKLMWEKSAYDQGCDDCAYIGQMTSKPIIAQVADGKWAVLIGNGYNSDKNQAALLQFSLSDGTLHAHTTNTDTDNGLSGPAIWIADSTDNIGTVAYAGDLYGHVWSFPLDTDGSATPSSTGTILFTAKDASDHAQPITSALAVQMDVATGKRWVFFGTGKYLSQADIDDDSTQTWYGLIVNDAGGNVVVAGTRKNLVERKIVGEGTDSEGNKARAISEASEVDAIGKTTDGWYIDLSDTGERMVAANQFNGSLLYGTSIMPSQTDPCDPSGSGWVMAIDPFTGTNPDWDVFGSTLTTGDKTRNTSGTYFDSMPNAPIFLKGSEMDSPTRMYNSTSSGEVKDDPLKNRDGAGKTSERVSWREVVSD